MTPVRVVTANIQAGLSATGQPTSEAELAAAFTGVEADVVALQEVDRHLPRSGYQDQVAIIAQALDLPHYHYAAALAGDLDNVRMQADPIGDHPGPAYGIALATRYPVLAWFTTRMPRLIKGFPVLRRGRPTWWAHEPRVGLAAVLAGPSGPFAVANTHLSLLSGVARRQLRTLLGKVGDLRHRAVVCGDFNLPAPTVAGMATGWQAPAGLTFPAHWPEQQIDHILVRGGTAENTSAPRLPISDHRALITEVRWT